VPATDQQPASWFAAHEVLTVLAVDLADVARRDVLESHHSVSLVKAMKDRQILRPNNRYRNSRLVEHRRIGERDLREGRFVDLSTLMSANPERARSCNPSGDEDRDRQLSLRKYPALRRVLRERVERAYLRCVPEKSPHASRSAVAEQ
jgi:hypothetical protein